MGCGYRQAEAKGVANWLKQQRGRAGGKLIRWAQKENAEEGYTGLKPEPEGATQTINTRLEAATSNWGAVWAGGARYTQRTSEPLEPIDCAAIGGAATYRLPPVRLPRLDGHT